MEGTTEGRNVENAKQERNKENNKTGQTSVKEGHLQRNYVIVFDMPVYTSPMSRGFRAQWQYSRSASASCRRSGSSRWMMTLCRCACLQIHT
jgi:hypothetical protein